MAEFENIEFFRSGYGMLPDMGDKDPGTPICLPRHAGGPIFTGKCDCRESRGGRGCSHLERLMRAAGQIERKRRLMSSVVQADDPHLEKIFTREELIGLLQPV